MSEEALAPAEKIVVAAIDYLLLKRPIVTLVFGTLGLAAVSLITGINPLDGFKNEKPPIVHVTHRIGERANVATAFTTEP